MISAARPALSFLALLDTVSCVGASLASNSKFLNGGNGGGGGSSSSTAGLILAAVLSFHALCALAGLAAAAVVSGSRGGSGGNELEEDEDEEETKRGLGRCLALQGGMQSSLLALFLATSTFKGDPLVSAAAGVSTAAMTVMGFALVQFWRWRDGKRKRGG